MCMPVLLHGASLVLLLRRGLKLQAVALSPDAMAHDGLWRIVHRDGLHTPDGGFPADCGAGGDILIRTDQLLGGVGRHRSDFFPPVRILGILFRRSDGFAGLAPLAAMVRDARSRPAGGPRLDVYFRSQRCAQCVAAAAFLRQCQPGQPASDAARDHLSRLSGLDHGLVPGGVHPLRVGGAVPRQSVVPPGSFCRAARGCGFWGFRSRSWRLFLRFEHHTMIRYSYPFRTLNLILPLMYSGWLVLVFPEGRGGATPRRFLGAAISC